MKYKFEPVTNLSTAELIEKYLLGEEFYSKNGREKYLFEDLRLGLITGLLDEGHICRRIERQWTDNLPQKCVVWNHGYSGIRIGNVIGFNGEDSTYLLQSSAYWENALPITGTETIAEIEAMIAEAGN